MDIILNLYPLLKNKLTNIVAILENVRLYNSNYYSATVFGELTHYLFNFEVFGRDF